VVVEEEVVEEEVVVEEVEAGEAGEAGEGAVEAVEEVQHPTRAAQEVRHTACSRRIVCGITPNSVPPRAQVDTGRRLQHPTSTPATKEVEANRARRQHMEEVSTLEKQRECCRGSIGRTNSLPPCNGTAKRTEDCERECISCVPAMVQENGLRNATATTTLRAAQTIPTQQERGRGAIPATRPTPSILKILRARPLCAWRLTSKLRLPLVCAS
jgi:hypothetical protein